MSKEFSYYEIETQNYKVNFYRFMDLLVTNKSTSRMESILLISISYTQIIVGFFSNRLAIFTSQGIVPDNYMTVFHDIVRIKELFYGQFEIFSLIIYMAFFLFLLLTGLFMLRIYFINKSSFYSFIEMFFNYFIKIFLYVLFNPLLDFCLSIICFDATNRMFPSESCDMSDKILLSIICIVLFFYLGFLALLFAIFYNDSILLSNSYYARMSSNYEVYMTINSVIFAILLSIVDYIGAYVFIIYNIIISAFLLRFFFKRYPFYDRITNFLIGWFHLIYLWTALFSLLFKIITLSQVSIIYFVGCFLILFLHYNFQEAMNKKIIFKTPFHKLNNRHFLLFYIKSILRKIDQKDSIVEEKAELIGIICLHKLECPNPECLAKTGKRLYLPMSEEWSDRIKNEEINDKVFLMSFIIFIFEFYIIQNYYSEDILLNFALYYLQVIGNHIHAMYYCQKASELKMTTEEKFLHFRVSQLVSRTLVEKLRPSNEITPKLEEVNTTMYFKYQELSEKFFCEISSDITLSIEFWNLFKIQKGKKRLDFNYVFSLTDKIRITKNKIEKLWEELFATYNGYNELFDLYECYVEYINDDDLLTRELMTLRNRINIITDNSGFNYYNVLFSENTGIIIASGNKGKEGMIEKVSEKIPELFKYNEEEMKGMNVNSLMPKMFEKQHRKYMQRLIDVGEKKVLDKSNLFYGKDKSNNILVLNIGLKLFPMLVESTFFIALITKEGIDDVVVLDSEFNIQGMSEKLMNMLKMNENIFQDCDVPFWMICKKFIYHFQTFMMKNVSISKKSITNSNRSLKTTSQTGNNNQGQDEDPAGNKNSDCTECEFEINENADVEWEIQIPTLFKLYISEAKKQNFINFTMGLTRQESNDNIEDENGVIYENSKESSENYEEDAGFIRSGTNEIAGENGSSKNMRGYNPGDHDKEFQNAIGKYRTFFSSNNTTNHTELIQLLDKLNEGNEVSIKFFVSFRQIHYGDRRNAYVIRLIDNKFDIEVSSGGRREDEEDRLEKKDGIMEKKTKVMQTQAEAFTNDKVFDRRKYLIGLESLEEATNDDIEAFSDRMKDYHRLSLEEEPYMKDLDMHRTEIKQSSRVLGNRAENGMDETASQSSSSIQALQDISKKSRVQEVKAKIMSNVNDFYTLKCIKFLYVAFIAITAIFTVIYAIIFEEFLQSSLVINQLHSDSILTVLFFSDLLSTLASLKGANLILISDNSISFNAYTHSDIQEYFNTQKVILNKIADEIYRKCYSLELNYTQSITTSLSEQQIIWKRVNPGYNYFPNIQANKQIGLLTLISRTLTYTNSLLNSDEFQFTSQVKNKTSTNDNLMAHKQLSYMLYNVIENSYISILPSLLGFCAEINSIYANENKENIYSIISITIVYLSFVALFASFYMICLYLTNKSMEDGLQTVSRIDPQYIDEVIKQIESFNQTILSKFRGKNNDVKAGENVKKTKNKFGETIDLTETRFEDLEQALHEDINNNNDYDPPPHKKLQILSLSYLQTCVLLGICCSFLIPIYFKSMEMVTNANMFLDMKSFFYGDLISSSVDMLNLKLAMMSSQVPAGLLIEYENAIDEEKRQSIVNQINFYPEMKEFYKSKYILNICATIFDAVSNSSDYVKCTQDKGIKSNSNTQDLLKSISDSLFSIRKDIEMNIQQLAGYNIANEFQNHHFQSIEYTQYTYLLHIPPVLEKYFTESLSNYVSLIRRTLLILIILFAVSMLMFSLYVIVFYIDRLIHLLLISRCIFKIIPTKVINKTKELEDWIDNKY